MCQYLQCSPGENQERLPLKLVMYTLDIHMDFYLVRPQQFNAKSEWKHVNLCPPIGLECPDSREGGADVCPQFAFRFLGACTLQRKIFRTPHSTCSLIIFCAEGKKIPFPTSPPGSVSAAQPRAECPYHRMPPQGLDIGLQCSFMYPRSLKLTSTTHSNALYPSFLIFASHWESSVL